MRTVCHLTSVHPSNDVRIFYKMCTSLANAGYNVYLVAPGESREENGVHVIGLGEKPQSRISRMTKNARKAYEAALRIDADLYHFHDPELLPYGMMLKSRGKKVVFDSHEFYEHQILEKYWIPLFLRKFVAKAYKSFERYVCKRLDAVVAICDFDGRNYFEGTAHRVRYIANLPLVSEFSHIDKQPYDIGKRKYVCYVGGISFNRGATYLVKACAQAMVPLCLCGAISPARYENELSVLPEWSNVDYRGLIGRPEVGTVLEGSIAGIATVLNKSQFAHICTPLVKVYEYMAAGIPVILSDTSFNVGFIQREKCGVCVDPQDCGAISQAIRYLVEHPDEAKEMGEHGREAVAEKYNWRMAEKELFDLYNELLS